MENNKTTFNDIYEKKLSLHFTMAAHLPSPLHSGGVQEHFPNRQN